jgi:hypothetical protein
VGKRTKPQILIGLPARHPPTISRAHRTVVGEIELQGEVILAASFVKEHTCCILYRQHKKNIVEVRAFVTQ